MWEKWQENPSRITPQIQSFWMPFFEGFLGKVRSVNQLFFPPPIFVMCSKSPKSSFCHPSAPIATISALESTTHKKVEKIDQKIAARKENNSVEKLFQIVSKIQYLWNKEKNFIFSLYFSNTVYKIVRPFRVAKMMIAFESLPWILYIRWVEECKHFVTDIWAN